MVGRQIYEPYVLSFASVYLPSALDSTDFGSARYGLAYATERQGR
jgi:hypothetical protein